MDLKGLKIKESMAEIKHHEKGHFYQVYIITEKTFKKDLKKVYKRIHFYNEDGKRAYKIHTIIKRTYANDESLEQESFIINFRIEKGQHSLMDFEGHTEDKNHNIYYLIVDHLQKGNKGATEQQTINTEIIKYKEGELTKAQRRITL